MLTRKVTITLSGRTLRRADRLKNADQVSRSALINRALDFYLREREKREMAEGYKVMAERNRKFVEDSFHLVNETWPEE